MHVCAHTCPRCVMRVHVCTGLCVRLCTCLLPCAHVCTSVYVYAPWLTCVCVLHMCASDLYVRVRDFTCMYVGAPVFIYTCMYCCVETNVHVVYVWLHVWTCFCVCALVLMRVQVFVHLCACAYNSVLGCSSKYECLYTCVCEFTFSYISGFVNVCICARTCAHVYVTVYAESNHMSAEMISRYGPRRSKR